mmetsp:Transcript_6665/g.17367  ORF Transcript_6665/g.17367 Transcript_6665/m.17367 type:complete len:235 (-) Transcript_6665:83-787(-)
MTAGDVTFAGGFAVLPRLAAMPDFSLETLQLVVVPAFSIALISSLEMLLAQRVVDDTGVPGKTDPDASIAAMAGGNAISAALGGFGGCGLIPQTLLNSQAGGQKRLSAAAYAIAMASFVVFAAPLVGEVPLAALAGVMITVGAATVQWVPTASAIKDIFELKRLPAAAALLTATAVCFEVDMAFGIWLSIAVERALTSILPAPDAVVPLPAPDASLAAKGALVVEDEVESPRSR